MDGSCSFSERNHRRAAPPKQGWGAAAGYIFSEGVKVHSYLVELNIAGDSIGKQALSRQIGLEATRFFKKGEEKSPGRVRKQSVWSLEVLPADGKEWLSLEDGLTCLLGKLMPGKD